MASRTGTADLPLHGGKAPRRLFERMARLAPAIVEALVIERRTSSVNSLARLPDRRDIPADDRYAPGLKRRGRAVQVRSPG